MAETLKLGNGIWATKNGSLLAYNSENGNYKPLPFDFTRASSATVVNKAGLIETVQSGIPRIDFLGNTNGALLLEPQRSNLITNSEKFVDAPTGATNMDIFSGTITNNSTTSPDNNTNGMKFTIGAGSSSLLRIYQSDLSTTLNTTFSIYAKKGTSDSLSIDISGGTPTNSTLTDEWQRISTTDISNSNKFLDVTVSGNSGEYIYIWAFQAEVGSYSTSLIPTQGSTVTRIADACTGAGNDQVINSAEGVFYAELENNELGRVSISDGTYNNLVLIQLADSSIVVNLKIGGIGNSLSGTGISGFNKIAIKWNATSIELYINGVLSATALTGSTLPANTLDSLQFNRGDGSSSGIFYGNCKDLQLFTTALTGAELIALTTI